MAKQLIMRGLRSWEIDMVRTMILGTAFAFVLASPGLAGPCTQRLADLEKSVTAKQEGAGPTLDPSATTGSSTPSAAPGQGVNVTAQSQGQTRAMEMIQQAKQLDQQGKEAECMNMANQIGAMAPPATK
jgi:hypothetical protein